MVASGIVRFPLLFSFPSHLLGPRHSPLSWWVADRLLPVGMYRHTPSSSGIRTAATRTTAKPLGETSCLAVGVLKLGTA